MHAKSGVACGGVLQLIPYVGQELAKLFESAEGWGYVPVGSQEFITSAAQIVPNYSVVVWEFGSDLYNEDFSSFGDAHSLAPGGRYDMALAPGQGASVTAGR